MTDNSNMLKLRNLFYFLIFTFLIILIDKPGFSDESKTSVIVFDFAAVGDEEEIDPSPFVASGFPEGNVLGRIFAHNMDRSLSRVKELIVIDRSHWTEAQRLATTQRIRPARLEDIKGVSDSLTARDLGKMLGADVTITGQMQVSASGATVIAQAIKMESGEVLGVEMIEIEKVEDIPPKAEELAIRLLPYFLPVGEVLAVEMDRAGSEVEIGFYDGAQVKPGEPYRIFRPGGEIKDPRTRETLAPENRTAAQLSATEIRQDSFLASLVSLAAGEEIEIGDKVWLFEGESGYLSLSSSPSRAMVYVGDRLLALTPLNIVRLAPGNYTLRVVKEAYKDHSQEIELSEGGLTSLQIDLEPNFGGLEVSSQPSGAKVYIDRRPRGQSPGLIEKVVVGSHEIRLTAEGYEDWFGSAEIDLGLTTQLAATMIVKRRGDLIIDSFPPGGEVYVNEESKGTTPLTLESMRIGSYQVRIAKTYFQDWEGRADIEENQQSSIKAELIYSDPTLVDDFEDTAQTIPSGRGAWRALKDEATLTSFRKTSSTASADSSEGVGRWSYNFPGDNRPHHSGIGVVFDDERPEDWSEYESLSVQIRADNPTGLFSVVNDVSLKAFLHDPNVTLPPQEDTWKIVVVRDIIRPESTWNKIEVPLNLFLIDEGWLSEHSRSFWDDLFGSDKKNASTSIDWSKVYGFELSVEAEIGRNTIFVDNLRLTRPEDLSRPATEG